MESLEAELGRARDLDEAALADAIERIGFECTRCGACCTAPDSSFEGSGSAGIETGATGSGEHAATVFPDEVRRLQAAGADGRPSGSAAPPSGSDPSLEWRDVARPIPYGLAEGPDGPEGETFEWALQTDDCGDCTFYEEREGTGACTVYADRPLVCRTYPFSVALGGTSQPLGDAVDRDGIVRAHECEGLGRDISRVDAEALAATLKERAVRELEEAVAVRDRYEPADPDAGEVVVHDSEGRKRPDGEPL